MLAFNKARAKFYPYNEVYLEAPKKAINLPEGAPTKHQYVRLDSYNPHTGEIVSRKYTQLSEVSEETAFRYLKELSDKYAPGSVIADVPSNRTGLNKGIFEVNQGRDLKGKMILEVPVQDKVVPKRVIDDANKHYIKIRDINGKIYN